MATAANYSNYSVEEFIKDEFFQQWVYSPDRENSLFWEEFLTQNPSQAETMEEARQFLYLLDFNEVDVFQSRINALKNRIDFSIDHPGVPKVTTGSTQEDTPSVKLNKRFWFQLAAAAIGLLLIANFFVAPYFYKHNGLSGISGLNEQTTDKGQRTIISLEDGTKVWLNVDSRIRYAESFKGKPQREVYLEGEAFFDVAKNKSIPFIVNTKGIRIKVLGTAFNVKSYEKDNHIQTTLVEGKVVIESMDEQPKLVTLAPNQMATYDKTTRKIILNNQTDLETSAGWKEGKLIFDDRPLSEIVVALERWYDVSISVEDDQSLKCHFSAKIDNLTLAEVLELFKASDGIDYTIDGRTVRITGSICEH